MIRYLYNSESVYTKTTYVFQIAKVSSVIMYVYINLKSITCKKKKKKNPKNEQTKQNKTKIKSSIFVLFSLEVMDKNIKALFPIYNKSFIILESFRSSSFVVYFKSCRQKQNDFRNDSRTEMKIVL